MDPHIVEWLNLVIRWAHMVVGVAWIGASFYFNWLENNLDRRANDPEKAGELWAIHGGGIYQLTKYRLAPKQMPETLHWFKWEAYTTWLSGILLLSVVYYLNAKLYLVAPDSSLSAASAIAISFGSFIVGWFIYSFLCDSPLAKTPLALAAVLFALLTASAYGYSLIFSPRAAYIHIGALIGTLMVGNVFAVIMPAQRDLLKAINENRPPNPALPAKGLLRSRHNNYLTLPVLFVMISNHFPSTYGHQANWLILAALAAVSILIRHYFNTRHQSQRFAWTVPVAALALISLAFITRPSITAPPSTSAPRIEFSAVKTIIDKRCVACHAAQPESPMFSAPPAGLILDTASLIQENIINIKAQSVTTQVMPLGNLTKMTEEERQILGQWIDEGASLK